MTADEWEAAKARSKRDHVLTEKQESPDTVTTNVPTFLTFRYRVAWRARCHTRLDRTQHVTMESLPSDVVGLATKSVPVTRLF